MLLLLLYNEKGKEIVLLNKSDYIAKTKLKLFQILVFFALTAAIAFFIATTLYFPLLLTYVFFFRKYFFYVKSKTKPHGVHLNLQVQILQHNVY